MDQSDAILRPGWFLLAIWLLSAVVLLLLGAIGWVSLLSGGPDQGTGWVLAVGATLFGAIPLALAVRSRLILSREGFRVRWLWEGRLVPWTAVKSFDAIDDIGTPAVLMRGVRWVPVGPFQHHEIPVFGRSREEMLATLESWRSRYSE